MFLYELFPPELIKVGLEAEDKDEVFEEMVDQFCQIERSDTREEILEALRAREAKLSTGIRKGIAVPHGKTNALQKVHGILGISKRGIDYDALDGQPVYLLFMVLSPWKESESHLRILKRLAQLLDNAQFFTDLIAQRDAQGVSGVIKKYEDLLIALD
ncbi:MAG: PTS sugar transporter subunit IIA [Treponema sp.]|jgi:PTS system fructose-specific IIC component/PTS system nitrogen regulatory IIA component|nr:PTS sugar transporter subunit IIA [Treponema sp.]